MNAACVDCRVYHGNGDGTGKCRLRPPVYVNGEWVWPVCADQDWCNAFLPIPKSGAAQ